MTEIQRIFFAQKFRNSSFIFATLNMLINGINLIILGWINGKEELVLRGQYRLGD